MEFSSKYDPKGLEDRIYKKWEDNGYFKPVIDKSKKPFTIVIPPPNITGKLHMGHALDNTIQDIFIRYNRMKGVPTLWVPGTDHASIATELKVVEKLKKEGITKDQIGREGFLKEAWKWKNEYGSEIVNQLKKLGSSCDWSRERFTMDEGLSRAVETVFVNLYEKDLLYRGERIVTWCPCCKTTISDAEVDYEEEQSHLWHIKYMLEGSNTEGITVATTRPETMFGDTAIAVHPQDERYANMIGKNVILPVVNRLIPVIADEYVEKEFGTGAVKITPAHDPNDFEVGLRHKLPVIIVIDESGKISEGYGKYSGMDILTARKEIVNELENIRALTKTEDYIHNVGKCYRCKTNVEPYISKQWFVKMEELAAPAIKAVKEGKTRFIPERFEKIYFNWMENIRDWCISRQLWWGHRIPAYYCDKCGEITVSLNKIATCKCGGNLTQDEDVLDTWFSSALWPFSTLGWPDKTEDFAYFYPTTMLVTGYDIITFWVSKMIFSAIENTREVPFKDVFIHGLVRDSQGRKMSKSLGNGIDPLEVMAEYGTDALRFSLIQNISAGNDIRYSQERVEAGRNFANKLWNAARFSNSYIDDIKDVDINTENLTSEDKWILDKTATLVKNVTKNIDSYEIGVALNEIYEFSWSDFCDSYIELIKPRLYNKESKTYHEAVSVLNYVLKVILKLLHPYMPFITEEIYMHLKHDDNSIMISSWPTIEYSYPEENKAVEEVLNIIKQVRNIKSTSNIPSSKKIDVTITTKNYENVICELKEAICKTAGIDNISVNQDIDTSKMVAVHTQNIAAYLDLSTIVDAEAEKEKISKDIELARKELNRAKGMLANDKFVSKAPQELIQKEKDKIIKYETLISKLEESVTKL